MHQTDTQPQPKQRKRRKRRKYSKRKLIRLLKIQAFMAKEYREMYAQAQTSIMELHTYYNDRLEELK